MERQTSSGSLPSSAARTSRLLSLLVRLLDERVDLVLKEFCDLHLVPEVEPPRRCHSTRRSRNRCTVRRGMGVISNSLPWIEKGRIPFQCPSARDVASNEPGHVIKYPVDRDGFGDDAAVVPAPPHGQINRVFGRTPAASASPYLKRVSISMSPIQGQESAPFLVLLVCLSRTPRAHRKRFTDGADPDERRRRKNVARSESPDGVYVGCMCVSAAVTCASTFRILLSFRIYAEIIQHRYNQRP
ncbi:hypothetical protein K438DRAFT_1069391 [Mycena galopus ATCC 62051]|nr:hypothetical protein K438DRAFT_1069391 [Mycena galopus ATCC 62051]